MGVTCAAERRDAVRRAASSLRDVDAVVHADVFDPDTGEHREWTLRVIVAVDDGQLPPDVLAPIVSESLATELHPPRGSNHYLLCVPS